MVIKRADHQRLETVREKLKYRPLNVDDPNAVEKNKKNYIKIMENLNMYDEDVHDNYD